MALLLAVASLLIAGCKSDSKSNPVVSVVVTPANQLLFGGTTLQLTAIGTLQDNSTTDLTSSAAWSSSDTSVASVGSDGVATANSLGTATITATHGGASGSGTVSVIDACDTTGNSTTVQLTPSPFLTSVSQLTNLSVNIPAAASAIGVVLEGTDTDLKIIEHQNLLGTGTGGVITDPNGTPVPLSFNQIDFGNGEENLGDNLLNRGAMALFFPNGGTMANLPAGTYTFPAGSADANTGQFTVDTLTPFVFYKTAVTAKPVMNVELFVVQDVGTRNFACATGCGVTSADQDTEIAQAITTLQNVYRDQVCLTLNVTVSLIADNNFLDIDTEAKQDTLFSTNPSTPPNSALKLFVVDSISYIPGGGVIGLSAGVPGPFNRDGTIVSGTLAVYQADNDGTVLGFTLAHEFGHFLGLWHTSQTNNNQTSIIGHDPIADTPECSDSDLASGGINNCPDRTNLMFPIVDNNPNPPISAGQWLTIKLNPAVSAP